MRNGAERLIFKKVFRVLYGADLSWIYCEVKDLTAFVKARKFRSVSWDKLPLTMFLLSALLAIGVFCGYVFAANCAEETSAELGRYFEGYFLLASQGTLSAAAVLRTLLCFFRAPLLAFLLGFASIGVALIPLLCAFEGFLFAFSLFSFASTLGRESFPLLLALFAIRMLFMLPATLILSVSALDKARSLALFSIGNGKRVRPVSYGTDYWYRFGICCVCLLIGSVLELWLVPQFLALAAS